MGAISNSVMQSNPGMNQLGAGIQDLKNTLVNSVQQLQVTFSENLNSLNVQELNQE